MVWQIIILTPLAVAGFVWYWRRWTSMGPASPLPFGMGDALVATLLALWFLMLVLFAGSAAQKVTEEAIIQNMIIYVGLLGLIVIFVAARRVSLRAAFRLRWEGGAQTLRDAGLALICILPVVLLAQALSDLLPGAEDATSQAILEFWVAASLPGKLLVILLAVGVAPIVEEFIFRGYLYGTAKTFVGFPGAMLASSALFAAIHLHVPVLAGLFLLSVGLTVIYEFTRVIWVPVLVHSGFNAIMLTASLIWLEPA